MADIADGAWEIGQDAPLYWREAAKEDRTLLDEERCVIRHAEGDWHFLKGRLSLPVAKASRDFAWLIWVSVSEATWALAEEHRDDPARAKLKPAFGWLANELPYEPGTLELPTTIAFNPRGELPSIWVNISSKHRLGQEQRGGISAERLEAIRRGEIQKG